MYVLPSIFLGLCTLNVVSSLQCYQCITADYVTVNESDKLSLLGKELRQCTDIVTCGTGEVCGTIPVLLQGNYENHWFEGPGRFELGSRARTCVKEGNPVSRYSIYHIGKKQGFSSTLDTYLESVEEKFTAMGAGFELDDEEGDEPTMTIGKVEKCSTDLCNKVVTSTPTSLQCYSCTTATSLTTDGFSEAVESSIESLTKEIAVPCTKSTTCVSGAVCGKIPWSLKGSYEDSKKSGSFELRVMSKRCVWEGQGSYEISSEDSSRNTFYSAMNIDAYEMDDYIYEYGWKSWNFEITRSMGSLEMCNSDTCNSGAGTEAEEKIEDKEEVPEPVDCYSYERYNSGYRVQAAVFSLLVALSCSL